jgi:hypothetical protein
MSHKRDLYGPLAGSHTLGDCACARKWHPTLVVPVHKNIEQYVQVFAAETKRVLMEE